MPSSPNLTLRISIFYSLYVCKGITKFLLFNPLIFSLFVEELINEILEQLLPIPFLDVLEAAVDAHEACHLVELAHPVEVLALLLQQLREALLLLLPSEACFVAFPRFLFVYKLVESGFALSKSLQSFDSNVVGSDTLGVVPSPGGCHTRCFQGIFEDRQTIFFRKGV